MPHELPYIASKAVVQQLTAALAVELAPRGITVNCVNPGPNDSPGTRSVTSAMLSRAPCQVVGGADRRTPPDW